MNESKKLSKKDIIGYALIFGGWVCGLIIGLIVSASFGFDAGLLVGGLVIAGCWCVWLLILLREDEQTNKGGGQ